MLDRKSLRTQIAGLLLVLATAWVQAAERPNIIFILADDMGSGDVQALNPDSQIPTPNLNRLAAEGMTFTDAHSPSAVCTPTRYATLTGRYCWRSTLKSGVLNGYGQPLIEKDRPTVASHLQDAGYQTAVIGKWHLGLGFKKETGGQWDWSKPLDYSPIDAGFNKSLVIPASLDFPPYVYIDGHQITGLPNRVRSASKFPEFLRKGELGSDFSIVDCLDRLTDEAVSYIKEQSKSPEPFMLYFPLTAPHKPVMPHPRYRGKSKLGPYGDFVIQVDDVVGRVLDTIDELKITENTLVIYTSDNGSFMYRQDDPDAVDHVADSSVQAFNAANHKANGWLRGTKADIWEAGHRVPFFAKWPKQIKAGTTCDQTICHVDFFATAAELAGKKLPSPKIAAPDSFSLLPLFVGKERQFKRAPVINHSGGGMFALRDGPWKLVFGNGSGGREKPKGKRFELPFALFNLEVDPQEKNDLSTAEPRRVQQMQAKLMKILADERSR